MRTCKINIKDKDYELCLNRKAIKWLENSGFNLAELESKPLNMYDLMFSAGFVAKYPNVDAVALMEEYEAEGGDTAEVVSFLIEEYMAFINALTDTKSKATKKMEIL